MMFRCVLLKKYLYLTADFDPMGHDLATLYWFNVGKFLISPNLTHNPQFHFWGRDIIGPSVD